MCKNKIVIKNKRYQPTKKNGYTKETGEASKKPIELKIEQTNKEMIIDKVSSLEMLNKWLKCAGIG